MLLLCGIGGLVILVWKCRKGSDARAGDDSQTPLLSVGDPMTSQGQTVPRGTAIEFLRAIEAEYMDGVEGEVGGMFERLSIGQDDQDKLNCEEAAIQNADNTVDAVCQLARRWDMRYELAHH